MHHVHGYQMIDTFAGEPRAVKAACVVRKGAHEKVPFYRQQLVGCLPYSYAKGVPLAIAS